MNQSTKFYTKNEVAEILRISVRTVSRYMKCGMPYKKVRGAVRIPEDMLMKWLKEEEEFKIPRN